jgi:hypothetical protein
MLLNAAMAITMIAKKVVCEQFRACHSHFPCEDCKTHFGIYLMSHPPEAEIDELDGLFDWVVDFLNSVCARTGKPLYDRKILYPMFHESGYITCDSTCSGGDTGEVYKIGEGPIDENAFSKTRHKNKTTLTPGTVISKTQTIPEKTKPYIRPRPFNF